MIELTYKQLNSIGLQYVLDGIQPVTPFGAELLKNRRFYSAQEQPELMQELSNVEAAVSILEESRDAVYTFTHKMAQFKDIRGSLKKCRDDALDELELFQLNEFIRRTESLIPTFEQLKGNFQEIRFRPLEKALTVLDPSGSGKLSFYVEDSRTEKLAAIRRQKRMLENQINQGGDVLNELRQRRLACVSEEETELREIYRAMSAGLRPYLDDIGHDVSMIARLDFVIAKAMLAVAYGAVKPEIGGDQLTLHAASNPLVADALRDEGRAFTPISIEMNRGVTVLTGANMGGKSVALKTVALNVCLGLMGCFVFCGAACIPLFDKIELVSEDLENVDRGLSSFGGEIVRFNEIVSALKSGDFCFVAMDEFARGTNSEEGSRIVRSTVKYLNKMNAVSLITTHYDGAALEADSHYQIIGLSDFDFIQAESRLVNSAVNGVRLIAEGMNYGLYKVMADTPIPKDAINICRLLGMDGEILENLDKNY